jgi:purine-cytosine permease-like protein
MAKTQAQRRPVPKKKTFVAEVEMPQRINYTIIVAGIITILVGYLVMAAGDDVSPLSVTVGPLILVAGYCVLIPLGILYRSKKADSPEA